MIADEVELRVTLEQLKRMDEALASLRRDRARYSDEWFAILSEGPLEEIRRMEADLREYAGRLCPEERERVLQEIERRRRG